VSELREGKRSLANVTLGMGHPGSNALRATVARFRRYADQA